MSRYIDADALIADLEHDIAIDMDILSHDGTDLITRNTTQFDKDCKQNAIDLILGTPTADVRENVRAVLTQVHASNGATYGLRECSNCRETYQGIGYGWNYCPKCGAELRGEEDAERS